MMTRSLLYVVLIISQAISARSFSIDHSRPWQRRSNHGALTVEDVFEPMSYDRPPAPISTRDDHPQPPVGVNQQGPLQTNKFYASFFANNQDNRTWTYPYSVWWPRKNTSQGRGLSSGFPSLVIILPKHDLLEHSVLGHWFVDLPN